MKYQKKPLIIDAVQFDGSAESLVKMVKDINAPISMWTHSSECLIIPTLEGNLIANIGDWVIKGVKGEFYPCKPDIFKITYELAEKV